VEDAEALRVACGDVATVSSLCGYYDAEVRVKYGSLAANNPYVLGADEFYPTGTAYSIGHGRFFTAEEVAHSAPIVVLGAEVQEAIFPKEDPIGKDVTVNGMRYRVVGVLEKEPCRVFIDSKVLLPHGTEEGSASGPEGYVF
jgi:putative ABC transport system permease protein